MTDPKQRAEQLLNMSKSELAAEIARRDIEIDRLTHRCAEWEAKAATWMASPEAAQRLDGYRELGQRAARAEQQRDELLAALKDMIEWFDGADHEDGYCCCGDRMDTHAVPMESGHEPVDAGLYHASLLRGKAHEVIAKVEADK